jgi:hypothetical protein
MLCSSLHATPTLAIFLPKKKGQSDWLFWMVSFQQGSSLVGLSTHVLKKKTDLLSGMAVSGIIKEHLGFYGNFFLGMFFALLAMFYAIFFLKVRLAKYSK